MRGACQAVQELSAEKVAAWADLASRVAEPNPLAEPECVVPAATHLRGGHDIDLVTAEEDGRLFGCLAVRPVPRMGRLPVRTLTSDVRRMTYLGTPLVDAARAEDALVAMVHTLIERRRAAGVHLLHLKWLHGGGAVDDAVCSALEQLGLPRYEAESFERPLVRRRPEFTYHEGFNSKYRGVLARRRRQLEKELGGPLSLTVRDDHPEAVDQLIELEFRGYKGRNGVALGTVPGEREQFRAMCSAFSDQGRLQVLALEGNGRVAAMQLSLRAGGGLFALKVVHDEELNTNGPGVQMQLDAIRYFHDETDATWIDSCTYEGNDYLLRLYPDRLPITSYVVPLGGPLESGLVRALPGLRWVRRRVGAFGH